MLYTLAVLACLNTYMFCISHKTGHSTFMGLDNLFNCNMIFACIIQSVGYKFV
jgi:hypothetical protein